MFVLHVNIVQIHCLLSLMLVLRYVCVLIIVKWFVTFAVLSLQCYSILCRLKKFKTDYKLLIRNEMLRPVVIMIQIDR